MQLDPEGSFHLTYCTNIHPADGWDAVLANLRRFAPALKGRLSPAGPFGIGLRLSARDARELLEGDRLEAFRAFLDREGLYVALINGFPHGSFHRTAVKADVYAPDWRDDERVRYTLDLVEILGRLLPADLDGGVSTAPLSYKRWMTGGTSAAWDTFVANVVRVAEAMVLQRAADRGAHPPRHRAGTRLPPRDQRRVHRLLHAAPAAGRRAGARRVPWVHRRGGAGRAPRSRQDLFRLLPLRGRVRGSGCGARPSPERRRARSGACSSARRCASAFPDERRGVERAGRAAPALRRLRPTCTRSSSGGGADAPALRRSRRSAAERASRSAGSEWRIHFHVPLFTAEYDGLGSTQDYVRAILELASPDGIHQASRDRNLHVGRAARGTEDRPARFHRPRVSSGCCNTSSEAAATGN